ncbi:Der GTPase-activating protein YihI [Paraglaciecola sp. 2405UD69-4]|uniref:Der GTPase-activating protein YihI n=1 Tax=Paraglaciecola sp. 2405UD69-4 TaxID=3391836 RepID=UPI0039C97730
MPRQKKSRKVGQIGTPKTTTNVRKPTEKRIKKPKGKPAGTRNSEVIISKDSGKLHVSKDPRHGSKKPIQLVEVKSAPKAAPKAKIRSFSPAQELAELEQDVKLSILLEKEETGTKITREEQQYMNEKLARHKVLCELLGLTDDENEKTNNENSSNLYNDLDAFNIDDFKD